MSILKPSAILLLWFSLSNIALASMFLEDMETKKVRNLSEFTGQGKWTVVMFWASDCHVCNQEIDQYNSFHNKHRNSDAIVIGVSMDPKTKRTEAQEFVKRHKVPFTNLQGIPVQIAQQFQALTGQEWIGTPTFLVFSPQGELLAQQVGAVPVPIIEKFMANNP